jgi:diguanylate cyclase (GGDEF)-like protein
MTAAPTKPVASDVLLSLSERMGSLHLVRVALAVVVLATALTAPALLSDANVVALSVAFIGVSTLAELVRRAIGGRGLTMIAVVLLADGAYLSWIAYLSGGAASPLRSLVLAHLVAVTLIGSYRTGIKIAAWYSLLYVTTAYAEAAGLLPVRELVPAWLPGAGAAFGTAATITIAGLWLVTLATATLSALNERELRRRTLDLEELAEMTRELDRSGDGDDAATVLARRIAGWLGSRRVLVVRRSGDLATVVASMPEGDRLRARPAPPDRVLVRAWDQRRSQLVRTLSGESDPMLASVLRDGRHVVVTPMSAEGEVLGAVVVEQGRGRDRIHRWTVALIEQFASHAALVMRNTALLDEVRRMAATDGLTGIANRRTFEGTLAREVSRAGRTGEPVTLVMLDVDHFKHLNDELGHPAGDAVLRSIARGLGENLRPFDTVARFGGEEFAVIMPGCTVQESRVAAERIRRYATSSSPIAGVTLSAGAATLPDHANDATELVNAADSALYGSKRAGRDRLTIADSEMATT